MSFFHVSTQENYASSSESELGEEDRAFAEEMGLPTGDEDLQHSDSSDTEKKEAAIKKKAEAEAKKAADNVWVMGGVGDSGGWAGGGGWGGGDGAVTEEVVVVGEEGPAGLASKHEDNGVPISSGVVDEPALAVHGGGGGGDNGREGDAGRRLEAGQARAASGDDVEGRHTTTRRSGEYVGFVGEYTCPVSCAPHRKGVHLQTVGGGGGGSLIYTRPFHTW